MFRRRCVRWLCRLPLIVLVCLAGEGRAEMLSCAQVEALGLEIADARDSDPAAGLARGEQALHDLAATGTPCPVGAAMLHGGVATNLDMLGRHEEAVDRYQAALAALGNAGSATQQAFLHRGIGVALVALESWEPALQHYLIALAASDAAAASVDSAKTAGNIGILYTNLGDYALARRYHARALAGFEQADFKPGIAGSLINLGAVAAKFGAQASERGDTQAALREHRELLDTNRRARDLFTDLGNQRGVAYAESNIGLAWDRLGNARAALPHHEQALALRRSIGDQAGTINSLLSMALTLASLERHSDAATALDEADQLIPEDAYVLRADAERERVRLAEAREDHQSALAAQREVTRLVALAADATQLARLAALQDRFDADKAEREIALLRSEAHVDELRLQRQRLLTGLSLLVAVLAMGLLLVLFSRYRVGVISARKLAEAARTDPLTELPNRRHMRELLLAQAAQATPVFSLLMADLDDFKAINDQHGHDVGDTVLCEVAARLRGGLREHDTVARWGGEEFLFLLPDCDRRGAIEIANRLRERIASDPFTVGARHGPLQVTLTIGCCEYRPGMSVDDCIKAADLALYQGKELGKNRTQVQRLAVAEPAHVRR